MRSRECLPRTILRRRPVRRFFRQVGSRQMLGAGGFHEHVVAGPATGQGDTPTIDRCLHGIELGGDQQKGRD